MVVSQVLVALAALCLIPVFVYLFRAVVHRLPQVPRWFVYLIVIGPVFYAISLVIGALDRVDVAELFADRSSDVGKYCPAIAGKAGEECAKDLIAEDVSPLGIGLSLAGSVGTAFLFVMLPLRARRAGLMSQFMAILGVIAGALMVLQLMPLVPEVTRAFWLGAAGALFLGSWPGGRGPAWETGQADPWPSAADRRGLVPAGGRRTRRPAGGGGGANGARPAPGRQSPSRSPTSQLAQAAAKEALRGAAALALTAALALPPFLAAPASARQPAPLELHAPRCSPPACRSRCAAPAPLRTSAFGSKPG